MNAKRRDQEQLEKLDDKLFNYLKLKRAVKRKATEQFYKSMQGYHRFVHTNLPECVIGIIAAERKVIA